MSITSFPRPHRQHSSSLVPLHPRKRPSIFVSLPIRLFYNLMPNFVNKKRKDFLLGINYNYVKLTGKSLWAFGLGVQEAGEGSSGLSF